MSTQSSEEQNKSENSDKKNSDKKNSDNKKNSDKKNNEKKNNEKKNIAKNKFVPRARLQYEKYIPIIIAIWGYSWFIPVIIFYLFYTYFIQPDLTVYVQFFPIFDDYKYIIIFFISPLLIILLYLMRQFFVVLFSKLAIKFCNYRSPRKELIAAKGIGKKEAHEINYYHLRGTILRILKWEISKSPFPWMVPLAFNYTGSNKIGKGTVMEDQFYCKEFLETGENVYIGQGTIISSHLVEGKYGAITLKKVEIGDNAIIGAFNPISPGTYIGPYAEFLMMSGLAKYQRVRGFKKYFGLPVGRLSTKRYLKLLQIPEKLHKKVYEIKVKKKKYREAKAKKKKYKEAKAKKKKYKEAEAKKKREKKEQ